MSFNITQKQIDEMQETVKKIKELNRLNREDLQKMVDEEKKREEMKDLRYWESQYKKLSKEKITNNLKLIEIESRSKDCDDRLDYIQDIIKEYGKKKNDKIHLDYLQDFLNI